MSRDQRVQDNWALLFAAEQARKRRARLGVVFCLTDTYPGATHRAYEFMLRGLEEVERELLALHVPFILLRGSPVDVLPSFADRVSCQLVVADYSPMPAKKHWVAALTGSGARPGTRTLLDTAVDELYEVDTHNTVPVWIASDCGGGSRAIREKIYARLDDFLTEDIPSFTTSLLADLPRWPAASTPMDWPALRATIASKNDVTVPPVAWITPGYQAGMAAAQSFASSATRLEAYLHSRIDPTAGAQSDLSPYFHFGHIAPQRVARMAADCVRSLPPDSPARKGSELFIEQTAVRQSICDNWMHYTGLDSPKRWPDWAEKSLAKHASDPRPYVYTLEELEFGRTHDDIWNAAQHEMVIAGKMHAFLRMYWAKKILEWTPCAADAFDATLMLNDKYELDGRDPNGVVSIAWAIFGVHDSPFTPERPITGLIRPMTYEGCRKKFQVSLMMAQIYERLSSPAYAASCPELVSKCGIEKLRAANPLPSKRPSTEFRVRVVDNPHHREIVEQRSARPQRLPTEVNLASCAQPAQPTGEAAPRHATEPPRPASASVAAPKKKNRLGW